MMQNLSLTPDVFFLVRSLSVDAHNGRVVDHEGIGPAFNCTSKKVPHKEKMFVF